MPKSFQTKLFRIQRIFGITGHPDQSQTSDFCFKMVSSQLIMNYTRIGIYCAVGKRLKLIKF